MRRKLPHGFSVGRKGWAMPEKINVQESGNHRQRVQRPMERMERRQRDYREKAERALGTGLQRVSHTRPSSFHQLTVTATQICISVSPLPRCTGHKPPP